MTDETGPERYTTLPLTPTEKHLTELMARFPGCHAWKGVGDVGWYANYPRSSPQIVAGPVPLEKLGGAIETKLAERGLT